ncbi:hypothetical protein D3C80_1725930 [compost metagenome]
MSASRLLNCGAKPQKLAVLTTTSGLPAKRWHRSMDSLARNLGNEPCSNAGHSAAWANPVRATSNAGTASQRISISVLP